MKTCIYNDMLHINVNIKKVYPSIPRSIVVLAMEIVAIAKMQTMNCWNISIFKFFEKEQMMMACST